MGLREYAHRAASGWASFQETHPDEAARVKDHVLSVCNDMTRSDAVHQTELMHASEDFWLIKEILLANAEELGIRKKEPMEMEKELALWIRTICFLDLAKSSG